MNDIKLVYYDIYNVENFDLIQVYSAVWKYITEEIHAIHSKGDWFSL